MDIRLLIKQHHTLWKDVPLQAIHLEKLNGITNQTYKASVLNLAHSPIIFRKFGPSKQNPFLRRDSQAEIYECAHKQGCGPQIFYYNEQFRLEQYIESTILTSKQMLAKGYREEAAFSIGKFHELKLQSQSFPKKSLIQRIFIDGMQKIINDCSQRLSKFAQNEQQKKLSNTVKEWISKEQMLLLASYMKMIEKDGLVFCHNDLLPYNILIQDKRGRIVLIDYEFAGYNYPIYDLAYYLTESYFNYEQKQWPYFSCNFQRNYEGEKEFIEEYVVSKGLSHQELNQNLESLRQNPKYADKVARMIDGLSLGNMMVNLVWAYWRIMAGKTPNVPFDYWEFIKVRQQLYKKAKLQFQAKLHHHLA